ncbi:ABC transporter permease [Marinobacter sp. ANT_B65]|uniref:ABC transporter permease n=1 Tax=Marinobacter sp. ANT_B65 TaxID=2039467 RepID=UPI000BBEA611|nr:ABC transporter permease [Marinobacter sp. ANT_B65]PCM43250.1 ABC transporter permease [Marinobacter sp. ANT_B65]
MTDVSKRPRPGILRRYDALLYPLVFISLLLVAWEVSVDIFKIPAYMLPAPSDVLDAMDSDLINHTWVTLQETLWGFLIANIAGFFVAVMFVHFRPVELSLFPVAIALKTTPLVALAPLLVVWLGTGMASKIAASALICFFPVLINSVKGLRSIDAESDELFRTYQASRREIFWKLRLPASLPYVMSALKISSSLAVVGAIVGEFVGANAGLGYVVLVSSYHLDTDVMFSAIFAAAFIGLTFFWILEAIDRHFIFWQQEGAD